MFYQKEMAARLHLEISKPTKLQKNRQITYVPVDGPYNPTL